MIHAKRPAIAGLALVAVLVGCPRSKVPTGAQPGPTGVLPPPPPWSVPTKPAERLALAGLPRVIEAHKGSFHIHAQLRIYYQGKPVVVPAGIGIEPSGTVVSPLHTHRKSGVIHIEADAPQDFTLGQFFTLWGVPLTGAEVFAERAPVPDPSRLVFADQQQIIVIYGAPPAEPLTWMSTPAPEPVPSEEAHVSPAPTATPLAMEDAHASPEPTAPPVATGSL